MLAHLFEKKSKTKHILRFHKSLVTLLRFSWLVNLIWEDKGKEVVFVGWDWRGPGNDASVL